MPTFPELISSISTVSNDTNGNVAAPGPYEDGTTTRFIFLIDSNTDPTAPVMRAFKTVDSGETWAEQDAGNAPVTGSDIGSPAPGLYQYYTTVRNGDLAVRDVYVIYWSINFLVTIKTFHMATGLWGTAFESTLGYLTSNQPTSINTGFGGAYRASDNSVWFMVGTGQDSVSVPAVGNRVNGAKFALSSTTWDGAYTALAAPTGTDNDHEYLVTGMVTDSANNVHCFYTKIRNSFPIVGSAVFHQVIHTDGSLSTLQTIDTISSSLVFSGNAYPSIAADVILINYFDSALTVWKVARADVSSTVDAPTWIIETPTAIQATNHVSIMAVAQDSGIDFVFFAVSVAGIVTFSYIQSAGIGSPWSDPAVFIATFDNTGTPGIQIGIGAAHHLSGWAITMEFSPDGITEGQGYWEGAVAPPPPPPPLVPKSTVGGGTYFPRQLNKTLLKAQIARIYGTNYDSPDSAGNIRFRQRYGQLPAQGDDWFSLRDFPPLSSFFLFPNDFDLCLSRELALFDLIDRQAMSCARKPDCFLQQERDWLDSPPGWRTFNPVKAIPLPAPTDGDVVVLSFRVPYGYDGVITAQYHGYTQNFTEGSGDLQWRISADDRLLRDCGDMLLTIGSPKQLSPVYGGLQLRSGNLVKYIVSAPNLTSTLPPPGTGNILAGLHGFFYPRM